MPLRPFRAYAARMNPKPLVIDQGLEIEKPMDLDLYDFGFHRIRFNAGDGADAVHAH